MKGKAWEKHDLVEEHDSDKRKDKHKMVEGGRIHRNNQISQNVRKVEEVKDRNSCMNMKIGKDVDYTE